MTEPAIVTLSMALAAGRGLPRRVLRVKHVPDLRPLLSIDLVNPAILLIHVVRELLHQFHAALYLLVLAGVILRALKLLVCTLRRLHRQGRLSHAG